MNLVDQEQFMFNQETQFLKSCHKNESDILMFYPGTYVQPCMFDLMKN